MNSTSVRLVNEITLFLRLFSFLSDKFFQNAVNGFGYNSFDFFFVEIYL